MVFLFDKKCYLVYKCADSVQKPMYDKSLQYSSGRPLRAEVHPCSRDEAKDKKEDETIPRKEEKKQEVKGEGG